MELEFSCPFCAQDLLITQDIDALDFLLIQKNMYVTLSVSDLKVLQQILKCTFIMPCRSIGNSIYCQYIVFLNAASCMYFRAKYDKTVLCIHLMNLTNFLQESI